MNRISKIQLTVALIVAVIASPAVFAQLRAPNNLPDEDYAVFISQRSGVAELYLLNISTKQVSQLTNSGRGHLAPSISPDGRMIAFASREGGSYELFCGMISAAWRTRRPTIIGLNRLTTNPMDETSPSLNIDGRLMSFSSGKGIEMIDSNGGNRHTILPVSDRYIDFNPVISPDGDQIAFASNRTGGTGNYEIWIYTNSTSELRQLTSGAAVVGGLSWSVDSRRIAFTTAVASSGLTGIAIADVGGSGFRILSENGDSNPSISAKGDRLIFTSSRDGDAELYLLNLNTGKTDRLTHSMGLDDGAVFLPHPVYPTRRAP